MEAWPRSKPASALYHQGARIRARTHASARSDHPLRRGADPRPTPAAFSNDWAGTQNNPRHCALDARRARGRHGAAGGGGPAPTANAPWGNTPASGCRSSGRGRRRILAPRSPRSGSGGAGTARLEESVAAYRVALEERTRERVPLDWAMTQNNLGNALAMLGGRESRDGAVRGGDRGLPGGAGGAHPRAGAAGLGDDAEQPRHRARGRSASARAARRGWRRRWRPTAPRWRSGRASGRRISGPRPPRISPLPKRRSAIGPPSRPLARGPVPRGGRAGGVHARRGGVRHRNRHPTARPARRQTRGHRLRPGRQRRVLLHIGAPIGRW